jgi:prepilin peptidase CpaA
MTQAMYLPGAAREGVWVLTVAFAAVAGWTDWRWRRIPNWLTVPAAAVGLTLNVVLGGWQGAKLSLLGLALGFGLMLPFVAVKALGAGDLKLVAALGAFLGWQRLLAVLFAAVLIAGAMAVVLIVWKKRVRETARNIFHLLLALATLRPPQTEVTLDNPRALKVPFGVAVALAVLLYMAGQLWPGTWVV